MTFDPQVPEVGEGGRALTQVGFSQPGTYVLRAVADDTVLTTSAEVTVVVKSAVSGP